MPEDVFEQDLDGDRGSREIEAIAERRQSIMIWEARTEAGPGAEGIRNRRPPVYAPLGTLVEWKSTASRR